MENFRKLGIKEPILRVIQEEKFEKPTEIQEKSIPLVLSGKDVIGGSATGSGKTLAFGSAIIQNLERGKGILSLVLVPTRELAEQVGKALRKFSKFSPMNISIVYGGVGINPQIDALRKADSVVGTPGRILDHIGRNTINLRNVKVLVLDEADRMLDMGFIDDVEKIIRQCPQNRQTLLFSATISTDVKELCHRYMQNPVKVSAESYVDPSKLKQVYYDIPDNMKFSLLVHLLKHEKAELVMVFCGTRRNTDFVAKNLKANGIKALAIHGGFSQRRRSTTMQDFHSQQINVLVCTDVAARGLDIKGVSHVYNYDIPKDSKEYIHRIGRTARAGKEGKVINILASRDYENFSNVQRDHSLEIEKHEAPSLAKAVIKQMDRGPKRFGKFGMGQRFGRARFGRSQHRGPGREGHGGGFFGGRGSQRSHEPGLTRSERRQRGMA